MSSSYPESFRTHANYLRAFAMLCRAPYTDRAQDPFARLNRHLESLAPVAASATSMRQTKTQPDFDQTRSSIVNAWGTELLLAFGGQLASDDELLRVMNNWAVVQTYYTAYHAIQALVVARGQSRPDSHPKTQNQFASMWTDRELHLPPWSLAACDGGWRNGPKARIDDSINAWSRVDPTSCWNLAAKALRTTREEKLREALSAARDRKQSVKRRAWNDEERERRASGRRARAAPTFPRPQLTASEKQKVQAGVRSCTLLDYLYRLRIKTNYEDAGMFIEGPEDEGSSRAVHRDLVTLASCTMLVHELHVGAIAGKQRLMGWIDAWLTRHATGSSLGLGLRRDLLEKHLP